MRCGADLLLSGLNGDLDAEAKCPVCRRLTRIQIVDRKIQNIEPRDALLHVVEIPTKLGRTWVECESTHIFDKESCFKTWISTYKGRQGLVTSITDYQDLIVRRKTDTTKIVPLTGT